MPLITVLIPMRNAEPYVQAAVRSVLAQDGVELEVIVIDDGSTDRSAQIVRAIGDERLRIIPGPQRGIAAAFNAGLAEARGEMLARCDADDLYPPLRLQRQVRWLGEHPDFGAVCGAYSTITESGEHVADYRTLERAADVTDELRRGLGRSHMCAYLFRTQVLRAIGGCREWFVTSEDADLQYRLAEATRVWYDPQPAYLYRLHGSSITHQQASAKRTFFERMAREFQQQRRAAGQDDLQRGTPPAPPAIPHDETGATRGRDPREQVQDLMLGRAWQEHAAGHKGRAIRTGLRAWWKRPGKPSAWRSVLALLFKPAGTSAAAVLPNDGPRLGR
jgi:glycosyltransferase involved in cell wall biosynthesis